MTTAAKTTLTLTTPKTGVSISQSRARQNIALMGQAFRALARPDKNQWLLLGKQIPSKGTKRPTLSGYQAFTQVNGVRLSCAMPLLLAAPGKPSMPPGLASAQVTATWAGYGYTLSLACGVYSGCVQVWGAPPLLAGHDIYHPSSFKLLGMVEMESGKPADITALYQQQFKSVGQGDKIALTLYTVSAAGFRGAGLVAASGTLSMSEDGADEGPGLKAA